jgi:hypothetical protein
MQTENLKMVLAARSKHIADTVVSEKHLVPKTEEAMSERVYLITVFQELSRLALADGLDDRPLIAIAVRACTNRVPDMYPVMFARSLYNFVRNRHDLSYEAFQSQDADAMAETVVAFLRQLHNSESYFDETLES